MSRTPHTMMSRSSYVKLPDIDKTDKSKIILENFGINNRSVSKASIFEASRQMYNTPIKTLNHP